ncbi:sulfatase-like hydrolase/transferase [Paraglaciecola hydrolytica]|uniref:sulfatase-like hydrolase/transferase n=1 Tax=Paraglaciecola hydrolytica TaxID=1799789 RepID=UPI0008386EFA|nr:sulfatase-like hydrolase/transferase [Paraglaciecola hydrolytica]
MKYWIKALTLSVYLTCLLVFAAAASKPDEKNNIVLILIDDLSHYGMATYGSNTIRLINSPNNNITFETPNIDALAREGVRFEHVYSHPLCENTRVALMSGKQNNRNYLTPKSLHRSDITFSDVFSRAGYVTGMFGKWKQTRGTTEITGEDYIAEFAWDEYTAFDVVTEGQRFINPNLVKDGRVLNYNHRTDNDPATQRRWYAPDIFNRQALAFIDKNKEQPFFLYYPMALVHDDHKPTPDTLPKSIFDNFDEAPHNRDGHRGDDPQYIGEMIEYTDKMIGRIINKLNQHNLRENTLVIVMSDNGTKQIFEHILPDGSVYPGGKGSNADNGIHVGMVFNQPGTIDPKLNHGSYSDLVYVTDIFPTMADAVGVNIPKEAQLDGQSFWPRLMGQKAQPRQHIYSWYIGNAMYDAPINPNKSEFAFNQSYKYYAPSTAFPDGRFFDLKQDLFEQQGERYIELKFGVRRYSGLPIASLNKEQHQAYIYFAKVIADNQIIPIKKIQILAPKTTLQLGEQVDLDARLVPENTTRNGVIWHSSDPSIVSVNKFGEISALRPGKASIHLYSWDDARPLADAHSASFLKTGVQDKIDIWVK